MEEVWKDISLSSLQDHSANYSLDHHRHDRHHQGANFGGMTLQDCLSRPFVNESSPVPAAPPVSANPGTTMLNLNSVPELHFFDNPLRQNSNASGRKRNVPETEDKSTGDRRNQRMIKNRESAARSRARKQAYMNELEMEVAQLVQENARLKKQQQQLCIAAADQVPKKNSLFRTSTAPF